jgi:DivIVA domain-containing protein
MRQDSNERGGVTPEQVHDVTFPEASRGQGAYHRDEVDAFLQRVEATMRDATASGALTRADIDDVAFSRPPLGASGYREGDVDLFLERVKLELTRRLQGQNLREPARYLLYPYGGRNPQTPVRAIDVNGDAIRVIDLKTNDLVGSASFRELTGTPAQHGGIPVLVVDGPGWETMLIAPHPPPGVWRARPTSRKPGFLLIEQEWLTLVEKFGLAAELAEEEVAQNIGEHLSRFFTEHNSRRWTWRTFLMFGLLVGVPSVAFWGHSDWNPIGLLAAVVSLVLAILFWRFKWEF